MINEDDDLIRYKCLECDNVFYEYILEEDEICSECSSKNVIQYPQDEDYDIPSDEEIENELEKMREEDDELEDAITRWEDAQNEEI